MATALTLSEKLRASIHLVNARKAQQTKPPKRPKTQHKFTIEEAFSFDPSDYVGGFVRANLAIAFLLESLSDTGNRDVPGNIAAGLAEALRNYAQFADNHLKGIHDDEDAEFHRLSKLVLNLPSWNPPGPQPDAS